MNTESPDSKPTIPSPRPAIPHFGSLLAFGGVVLVRLLAPELTGQAYKVAKVAGYLLVIAGMIIIGLATRRKGSDAYILVNRTKRRGPGRDPESDDRK
mgnify:CR=1 FL=1